MYVYICICIKGRWENFNPKHQNYPDPLNLHPGLCNSDYFLCFVKSRINYRFTTILMMSYVTAAAARTFFAGLIFSCT